MAFTQPIVVCHSLPPQERKSTVLATFDGLRAFENFLLVSDHPQKGVLALLSGERPGLFEWSPLEEGPELWKTEITRRTAERAVREVTEALSWDHDRLDAVENEAFAALDAGDRETARERFATFARGLRRHIGFEEALIFPEFERRSGLDPREAPTAVLRAEHRELEVLLAQLEAAFADPDAPVAGLRSDLTRVLTHHNIKEEQVLYPGTDRLMNAEERDDLVRRVQAFTP